MKTFQTRDDVKRFVAGQIENYDMSCYAETFEELADSITEDYIDFMRDQHHWSYGEELPNLLEADWNRIFQLAE